MEQIDDAAPGRIGQRRERLIEIAHARAHAFGFGSRRRW